MTYLLSIENTANFQTLLKHHSLVRFTQNFTKSGDCHWPTIPLLSARTVKALMHAAIIPTKSTAPTLLLSLLFLHFQTKIFPVIFVSHYLAVSGFWPDPFPFNPWAIFWFVLHHNHSSFSPSRHHTTPCMLNRISVPHTSHFPGF